MDAQNVSFGNEFVRGDDYLFSIEVDDILLTRKIIEDIFQLIDEYFPINEIRYNGREDIIKYQLDENFLSKILDQHFQIGHGWYHLETSLHLRIGRKISSIQVEDSVVFDYWKSQSNYSFYMSFYSYLFTNRYRMYDYKNQKYLYFNNTSGARMNRKNMRDLILGIEGIINKPIDNYFSQELPRDSIYHYGILENAKIII